MDAIFVTLTVITGSSQPQTLIRPACLQREQRAETSMQNYALFTVCNSWNFFVVHQQGEIYCKNRRHWALAVCVNAGLNFDSFMFQYILVFLSHFPLKRWTFPGDSDKQNSYNQVHAPVQCSCFWSLYHLEFVQWFTCSLRVSVCHHVAPSSQLFICVLHTLSR